MTHGTEEEKIANYREYQEKRIIAECHGKAFRYPVIKSWFLDKYPEIADFGIAEYKTRLETVPEINDAA